MYGVFYTISDGCTYTSDVLLFVTENEQVAQDYVTLAELEYEQALKVSNFDYLLSVSNFIDYDAYHRRRVEVRAEYQQTIKSILTAHPERAEDFSREDDNGYYYTKVEVR